LHFLLFSSSDHPPIVVGDDIAKYAISLDFLIVIINPFSHHQKFETVDNPVDNFWANCLIFGTEVLLIISMIYIQNDEFWARCSIFVIFN